MSKPNGGRYYNRDQTTKKDPYWKIHLMRSVAPGQNGLENQLQYLREYTSDFVNYKEIGKLGVTLVMLEPISYKILGYNRNEKIPRKPLSDFERDLNKIFVDNGDCSVSLSDPFHPFGIYGRGKRYLGLSLSAKQEGYSLVDDRALILQHIVDSYGVSKRYVRSNTVSLKPHITLGMVEMDILGGDDRQVLNRDPNKFIFQRIREDKYHREKWLGLDCPPIPIIPESIVLNGLRAVLADH
jgi:hypothetical protein